MTYDEGERVERTMFSVPVLCTSAEARRIVLAVVATAAWREWSWRDDLLKGSGASVCANPEALARDATDAYRRCIAACAEAVDRMEAERSR